MKRVLVFLISLVMLMLTGCGGGGSSGGGSNDNNDATIANKSITAFYINNVPGVIIGHNIEVTLPFGSKLTSLVANFETEGKSVLVNGIPQTSGLTINDFTAPVIYTVQATDASTQNYKVIVKVANKSDKDMTSFKVNGVQGMIVGNNVALELPTGTDVTALVAEFAVNGEKVTVNNVNQISGITVNNFANPVNYTVHAADGSIQNYTVTILVAKPLQKDFTEFSLNGYAGTIQGNDIVVELPYGTEITALIATFSTSGAHVTVKDKLQESAKTSQDFTNPVVYTVHAADGSTQDYKVSVLVAKSSQKDITEFSLNGYAGNIQGNDIIVELPFGTDITTLIAAFNSSGDHVSVKGQNQTSRASANDFTQPVTYTVHAADGSTQDYTVTALLAKSSQKDITEFSLNGYAGNIQGNNIVVELPYGTEITALVATFSISGDHLKVNGATQFSGVSAQDFTHTVIYTVYANDGSAQDYHVSVLVAKSSQKEITSFALNGYSGNIVGSNITLDLPYGSSVNSLVATFNSTGDSVTVNEETQYSGTSMHDFTNPITYTVHAADGSLREYTVKVTVALNSAKEITDFTLDGYAGDINQSNHTINIDVPYGTDVKTLIATFNTSGDSVTVSAQAQYSGISTNDFTTPVSYTVHAANGSTQAYIVTVNVALNTAKEITKFAINGYDGVITNESITVIVAYSEDIKTGIAEFNTTGESVSVGAVLQTSKLSANDFSSAITYTVHAADGTIKQYVVTVIKDEQLVPLATAKVNTGRVPVSMAFSPDGKYAYVVNQEDNTVSQYAVDNNSGDLTPLIPATIATGGIGSNEIVVTPKVDGTQLSGLYAYVVNKTSKNISNYALNTDGTLQENYNYEFLVNAGKTDPLGLALRIVPEGGRSARNFGYTINDGTTAIKRYSMSYLGDLSPYNEFQTPNATPGDGINFPSSLSISPDNNFAYATVVGSSQVLQYKINDPYDNKEGTFAPMNTVDLHVGSSKDPSIIKLIKFSSDGKYVYVLSRHTISNSYNLSRRAINVDGSISSSYTSTNQSVANVADLALKPTSDKFIYVANGSTISQYYVAEDGSMKWFANVAVNGYVNKIVLSPNGKFAYALNRADNTVSQYKVFH